MSHALLSPSGAERWMACTPSARLGEHLPGSTSNYAKEGTLAHEIAELKARKRFLEPMATRIFNAKIKKLQANPLYNTEMLRHTDTYIDYLANIIYGFQTPPYISLEVSLRYDAYVTDGFGKSDCIIIYGNTLYVIDFKYGLGNAISSKDNAQMKCYALGACLTYSLLYPIHNVKMVIIQPRLDTISESDLSMVELLNWAESELKPKAVLAHEGKGKYVSGDHCKFCRANALCRARSEFNMSIEPDVGKMPPLITNEEIGVLLTKAQYLTKWLKDLESYALAQCLAGAEIFGWKCVEGRSNRTLTNVDEAFNLLVQNGIEKSLLYENTPIKLTEIEKLIGKKESDEWLKDYIIKPPGKPKLVLESDSRKPCADRTSAIDDFKNN